MSDESTDFLYPMIDGADGDVDELLADVASSARQKAATSATTTADARRRWAEELEAVADAIAERLGDGGRLFTFGNGGSATDAEGVAGLFAAPPRGRPLPARSLVADVAVLTALANDIGFEAVFARQLIAHARSGDVAIGFSTSGNSDNVLAALRRAHDLGVLTVGFAGNDGGAMATCAELTHCLVVDSQSVHRIQEAQSALAWSLWERVQARLAEPVDAFGAPGRGSTR